MFQITWAVRAEGLNHTIIIGYTTRIHCRATTDSEKNSNAVR